MPTFGRTVLGVTGTPVRVSADGEARYKIGGVTIDWNTVPANTADTTLADGTVARAGNKYVIFGTVLAKITNPATDVVTINGGPTGGTFTISVTAGGSTQTTAGLAYNASAATVQTAVRGLSNVGGTLATVTGSAGGPYTITFDNNLGAVTVTADGSGLTGGTTPTATVAANAPGGDVGYYGPANTAATDGRQTLTAGECYVLDETQTQYPPLGFGAFPSDHPAVIFGGRVWRDRLQVGGANQPTLAQLLAACPQLQPVEGT